MTYIPRPGLDYFPPLVVLRALLTEPDLQPAPPRRRPKAARAAGTGLAGRKVLVVEDEYLIATELAAALQRRSIEVVGPVGDVDAALRLVCAGPALDGVLLDVNLHGTMAFPVADALLAQRIPFVFATGYGEGDLPGRYAHVARCEKPLHAGSVVGALFG